MVAPQLAGHRLHRSFSSPCGYESTDPSPRPPTTQPWRLPLETDPQYYSTTLGAGAGCHKHYRHSVFKIASPAPDTNPSSASTARRDTQTLITESQSLTTLVGGGKANGPGDRTARGLEEYELIDYAGIQAEKEETARRLRLQARGAEKLRRLDEADEMKFSHSIQFNAVPDWSSHYIAYSNLKKLYVILPSAQGSTLTFRKDLPA